MSESLTAEQKLHKKLFEARKAARAVAKNGRNEEGNFDFARFEDVLEEASGLLDEREILVVPSVISEELRFSQSGFAIAKVVMEFEVIDTEGWGTLKIRWSGSGEDKPGDKAVFKGQTGCEKYFLAKLLRIPFGTDPEAVERDSAEAERVRRLQDQAAEAPQAVSH